MSQPSDRVKEILSEIETHCASINKLNAELTELLSDPESKWKLAFEVTDTHLEFWQKHAEKNSKEIEELWKKLYKTATENVPKTEKSKDS